MPDPKWRWFPIWKSSTNKVLIDLTYVLIPPKADPRGYLSVADDKLLVVLNQHGVEPKMYLKHYIDGPEFHALAQAVLASQRHFLELASPGDLTSKRQSYTWTDYKGSEPPEGVVSNRLSVTLSMDPGRKAPWIIQIEQGPGVKTATGAYQPQAGANTQKIAIYLSTMEMRQMMTMGLEHCQAQAIHRVAAQFDAARLRRDDPA